MPFIDRNSSTPYYEQVYEQIARGIEEGFYPVGSKLLSIRECARELAVSNTTVELAYQRLTEEGYVEAKRGSGYTVCALPSKPLATSQRFEPEYQEALEELSLSSAKIAKQSEEPTEWNFAYDAVDPSIFPYTTWARISRDVFFDYGAEAACLYNDPQGLYELREQISHNIGRDYGISVSPNQILVMPTTRDLVSDIMALFDPASTTVAMEEPGYDEVAK
jgi:GntR family transcriptional regulator/MocR family aminotransferase